MKKVIVYGGTGQVGRYTVEAALSLGYPVTVFGRSAKKLEPRENMTRFAGDITRPEEVEQAMDGHEAVICAFGAPLKPETVISGSDLCETGTRHILAAMRRHRATRLICQTSIGVGDSKGHGRFVFRNVIRPALLDRILADRERQEELVRGSDTDWTIVRPSELSDDETSGRFVSYENLEGVTAYPVARKDVGQFLAQQIDDHALHHKTVLIAGAGDG